MRRTRHGCLPSTSAASGARHEAPAFAASYSGACWRASCCLLALFVYVGMRSGPLAPVAGDGATVEREPGAGAVRHRHGRGAPRLPDRAHRRRARADGGGGRGRPGEGRPGAGRDGSGRPRRTRRRRWIASTRVPAGGAARGAGAARARPGRRGATSSCWPSALTSEEVRQRRAAGDCRSPTAAWRPPRPRTSPRAGSDRGGRWLRAARTICACWRRPTAWSSPRCRTRLHGGRRPGGGRAHRPGSLWVNVRFDQVRSAGLARRAAGRDRVALQAAQPLARAGWRAWSRSAKRHRGDAGARSASTACPSRAADRRTGGGHGRLPPAPAAPGGAQCRASAARRDQTGVWRGRRQALRFVPVQLGASGLDGRVQVLDGLKAATTSSSTARRNSPPTAASRWSSACRARRHDQPGRPRHPAFVGQVCASPASAWAC